jgi:hypothetical protein
MRIYWRKGELALAAVKSRSALFRATCLATCILQLGNARAGAVFVLLPGAATDAASTLDDTIAYDRNCSLAHNYMAALRCDNPARGWLVGAIRHLAAASLNRMLEFGRPICVRIA